jgi:hypothetical protein
MASHDAFISHSSKDKTTADAVCACLESNGIRCWYAPRDVPPGSSWPEAIINAISGSKVMVLIFSAHANDSLQVLREVERAASKGLPIVPLRTESQSPAPAFEFFLSTPHWLDAFPPPVEPHFKKLVEAVKRFLSEPTSTNTSAPSTSEIPDSDRQILDTVSLLLGVMASDYDTSSPEDKASIERDVVERLSSLRSKWNMPLRVFEFYIKICLEQKRVLHVLEFTKGLVEFIPRHMDYRQDVVSWVIRNAAGA